ncbi:hypothetical protein TNIN_42101 [Trichonephila inaurata madagascariensis]|uniref:DUF5641 domain-containing protein n=1 Tax=Trichonephila inaurata madagascariensis TaxID=2747483 RepID=A0A8X7BQS8_9ARAC|nr:hypothetical protein TNIN_458851 [Trichonephila inaurata madagascariensis]GFY51286.1 hypothetical protein TNIN_42101 [Trichonephila inaurata madagascariensis]
MQKAHETTSVFKVDEIVLIENPNKHRLYWPLESFSLEIQSAETAESNDILLDAVASKIPSANLDVSESVMIPVGDPSNIS